MKYKLAVLGSPVAHSRSPQLQMMLGNMCGVDLEYGMLETKRDEYSKTVARLISEGFHGFNCTMPLKAEAAMTANIISDEARRLVSANTVKINGNRLIADTTDGAGMILALEHIMGSVKGARVLVLGAGGAARSIVSALDRANAEQVTVLSRRNVELIRSPVVHYGFFENSPDCEELRCNARNADIIINATSIGMSGFDAFNNFSFIDCAPRDTVIADSVYNPLNTELCKYATACGHRTLDGLWMLVGQGVLAFTMWTGITPSADIVERLHENIYTV